MERFVLIVLYLTVLVVRPVDPKVAINVAEDIFGIKINRFAPTAMIILLTLYA